MTSKIIRWGIIGAGDVCEVKSGPAFQKAKNSQLLAVMRRNSDKARDFAQRHGVPQWYDNAEELLANPDIDAVYIATPPVHHKYYALKALAAGKHVYIEKPVALNVDECDAIIAAEQKSPNKVVVAHYRRAVPGFLKIKSLLEEGAIGRPIMVNITMLQPAASDIVSRTEENWRLQPDVSGGGLFFDLAPHQLDLLLHWFGPVLSAQGFSLNQQQVSDADDCTLGCAQLRDLVLHGRWHFAVNSKYKTDQCEIIGTEGRLSVNFFGQQIIHLDSANRHVHKPSTQEIVLTNPAHIQQPFIEEVNRYFGGERANPCSLEEAKAVMALMACFARPAA